MRGYKRFILAGILILTATISGQTLHDDTVAIRQILDANGLTKEAIGPKIIVQDGRVVSLNLGNLSVLELTAAIGKLTAMIQLRLSYCLLSELPPEIGACENLEAIYLEDNGLIRLPAAFAQCKKMRTINLNKNAFTEVPEVLFSLPELQNLAIKDNVVRVVGAGIGNCKKLAWLDMDENVIQSLPESLGMLDSLTTLFVRENRIDKLPESIVALVPKKLDLGYNRLDSNKMSTTLKAWADKYDPDWRKTQIVPISHFTFANRQSSVAMDVSGHSLRYTLSTPQIITLSLLNMQGRVLSQLYRGFSPEGNHTLPIQSPISGSGNYIIRLTTANGNAVQRVHVVR